MTYRTMESKKKTILLIGGAGYIGSYLCSFFLEKGFKIRVLDNLIYRNIFSLSQFKDNPNFEFYEGDLCDEYKVSEASKKVDFVILLAGLVGDPITKKYPDISNKINLQGLKSTIDFLNGNGVEKLIFISTCSNYGLIKEEERADENFKLKPLSLYSNHKVDLEEYILSKKGQLDYSPSILRFSTAFGLSPRMRFDLTVNEFTLTLCQGKPLIVYDENTWRPYCHVKDFANLISIIINEPFEKTNFEIFNAGGDQNNATKKNIIDIINSFISDIDVTYVKNSDDPRNYKVDFSKVENVLGFKPEYSIRDGVEEIINSFNNNDYNFRNINIKDELFGNYKVYYK